MKIALLTVSFLLLIFNPAAGEGPIIDNPTSISSGTHPLLHISIQDQVGETGCRSCVTSSDSNAAKSGQKRIHDLPQKPLLTSRL